METISERIRHEVDVQWTEGLHFEAHAGGETIQLASGAEGYKGGVGPKRLLLVALAGCTAMDVASLLPKMRVPFESMKVKTSATVTDEHPKHYDTIHMTYEIAADAEFLPKIKMAVEKSTEKYCGVHHMLGEVAEITYQIDLV